MATSYGFVKDHDSGDISYSGAAPTLGGEAVGGGIDLTLGTTSGLFAVAIGENSNANGNSTAAFGADAQATSTNAAAVGKNSLASGSSSIAAGNGSRATNSDTVAVGNSAQASGASAVAVGYLTTASSTNAVAVGQASTATGIHSIAIGSDADARAEYAISLGYVSEAFDYSVAIGENAHAEQRSVIIGSKATNVNYGSSVAIGVDAKNEEHFSVAIGRSSHATRRGEFTVAANVPVIQVNKRGWFSWSDSTGISSATEVEVFGGGSFGRVGMVPSSAITLRGNIVALTASGDSAGFTFEATFKRVASGDVTLGALNKTTINKDLVGFDFDVRADIVNQAIVVFVTGGDTTSTKWMVNADYTEIIT